MKVRVENYAFNAAAKTITFNSISAIELEAVLMIVNVTTQTIIYNPFDPAKGGTSATNVLTLEYNTASMNNADKLLIFYEAYGWSVYHLVSAGTTNAVNIKNALGHLGGWYIYNSNAAARKVAFHNSASAPTAGASVFFSVVIPPLSGANVEFANSILFSAGIGITTVTGLTDADATAVAASDLVINIFYK